MPFIVMSITFRITVNGMPEEVPSSATLADLIGIFGEMDPDLIVEHNSRFVFPQEYSVIRAAANDRVEFIHPNFGG
jgi:thiamine biosynthesis protein ThiS